MQTLIKMKTWALCLLFSGINEVKRIVLIFREQSARCDVI